jgi:hypothetical protein
MDMTGTEKRTGRGAAHAAGTAPPRGALRIATALARRWPTWLAIGMSALTLGAGGSDDGVGGLSEALLLLPLLYLIVGVMQRREASWAVLAVLLATMVALRVQDVVAPSEALVTVALIVLVWGALRGRLHLPLFRLQVLGMAGFGALALGGLAVDPDLGRYLVAAGWFLHGIWDLLHLRADKVVSRSFAEWCAVIDILIAVQLAFRL